jgi:hydrogenase nickel incorporation protein HypA/HybF
MNEIAIAEELYRAARAYADAHGAVRLQRVRVEVGETTGADVGRMQSAWQFVVQESADQDAVLEVEIRPVHVHCPSCGPVMRMENLVPRFCPKCHRAVHASGGTELGVVNMGFEMEVAEHAGEGGRH